MSEIHDVEKSSESRSESYMEKGEVFVIDPEAERRYVILG